MPPIVALLTDFGSLDPYVGIMKGVLLTHCPGAMLVDLSHEIPPQDIRRAALTLLDSFSWFPDGTVFLTVVDPGVGTSRRILAAEASGRCFVAPDNGVVDPVLSRDPQARIFAVERQDLFPQGPGCTFHGRDRMAPVAAALASGLRLAESGPAVHDAVRLDLPKPVVSQGAIVGEVLYVDHFGNAISNITVDLLENRSVSVVETAGRRLRLATTYADAQSGEALALVNSAGRLEVAVRDGHAAQALGLNTGAAIAVRTESRRESEPF